jgi:hypothetical protein
MGKSPEWVEENINWFGNQIDAEIDRYPKVWPIVQAHNDPDIISKEEFETVLKGGLSGKSSGVMMFTVNSVAQDAGKTEVMKKIYTNLMRK